MDLSDFDYPLDPDQIAQEPCKERDGARLMVLDGQAEPGHAHVRDLARCLRPGDLLVLNDTRVRHARLLGRKSSGGEVEILLLERRGQGSGGERWSALVRASRRPRPGTQLTLEGVLTARVLEDPGDGILLVELHADSPVEEVLQRHGRVPLPPYIHRQRKDPRDAMDRQRYQTVFAREAGSSAAPTAGLHLSPRLLEEIEAAGVELARVTLHVGPGTFQPIRSEQVEEHRMHAEWCRLTGETAEALRRARARGGRIVAVGTTVVRTLEARWTPAGPEPGEGPVSLFIRPGHRFQAVVVLLTNFHRPRSSLLVLVAAFAGRTRVLEAYAEAARRGYRFYSYGDAMWIAP